MYSKRQLCTGLYRQRVPRRALPDSFGVCCNIEVGEDKLANFSVAISVLVTNTGAVAGSTPVMAVYSKLTHGVVRKLRDLAGFVKVHVSIIRPIFSLDTTSRVRSVSTVCVGRL